MNTTGATGKSDVAEIENGQVFHVIPSLNGLRAISVMIVIVSHAGFGQIVPGGLGVTIFFFLSGYLITTLMLSEFMANGDINIRNFYARRAFRLFPPLIITLAVAYGLVYAGLLPPMTFRVEALLSQLFYFANYYFIFFDPGGTTPRGTVLLWSLAVEEHFYIIYPFVLMIILPMNAWRGKLIAFLTIACIVTLIWRIYLVEHGASEFRTYYASDTRIDSIIYGCLLAVWSSASRAWSKARAMSIAQWSILAISICCILLTLIYRNPEFRETYRYSLQGIALAPIFYFAILYHDNFIFRYLNTSLITTLGTYSYSIYLINFVVVLVLGDSVPFALDRPLVILPLALAISIAYAAMIDRSIDTYFRYLRKKFRSHGPRGELGAVETRDVRVTS